MGPLDILEIIKENWKDIVQYGAILATILIALFLKNFFRMIRRAIANLFSWDGIVFFILTSIYMLSMLIKLGII